MSWLGTISLRPTADQITLGRDQLYAVVSSCNRLQSLDITDGWASSNHPLGYRRHSAKTQSCCDQGVCTHTRSMHYEKAPPLQKVAAGMGGVTALVNGVRTDSKEAIVIAVLNEGGKLVMESVIETKASSILQFLHGLRGELHVTWEEGTWAAWLYDLLQPQVQHIVVCNPRRNALLKEGSKSDKVDARRLADLLRTGMLRPVYHGENGLRTLRELGRSYQTISKDLTRVMNRLKALYRGWGIACAGTQVYAARCREEWLSKIPQAGVRRRAELLYQQLDGLQILRRNVRFEFLAESET